MQSLSDWQFNSQELWFLLSMHGPATVPGFKDPTKGFLATEIATLENQAKNNLIHKSLLVEDGEHTKTEANLEHAIQIMISSPWITLISYQLNSEEKRVVTVYSTHEEYVVLQTENGEYYWVEHCKEISKIDQLFASITDRDWRNDKIEFTLSKTAVNSLNSETGLSIDKTLLRISTFAALPETGFRQVSQSLHNPSIRLSIMAFQKDERGRFTTEGVTSIGKEPYLWLFELESDTANSFHISQITAKELKECVADLLP